MKSARKLREEITALSNSVIAMTQLAEMENRDLSADEIAEVDKIQGVGEKTGEIQALQAQLDRAEKLEALAAKLGSDKLQAKEDEMVQSETGMKPFKIPAKAKSMGKLQAFKNEADAYAAGQFFRASLYGNKQADSWCREHGVITNAMTTGDNSKGGYLVPEPLEATIIELREKFGVFRQEASMVTMSQAVEIVPKMAGEVTTYFVGEGDPVNARNSITASDMALSQIKLEAKKLASFTPVSNELSEDAIISVADMLTRSIAYKMAYTEDDCGFNGDGTSTYGNIVGIGSALGSASKVTATSNTTFATLTMANFETVVGTRKMWPGSSPKWYISQVGWANSMQRLMDAYSGNTVITIANGAPQFQFLGYPVVISQVLNKTLTTNTGNVACYFGDLSTGVMFGSRRGLQVQMFDQIYAQYDAIAVRATQRFDINVHDRGDSSVAGGLVSLIFG